MFLFWCESGTDAQQQIVCPFYVVTEYPQQLIFHFLPPNTVFSGLSEVAGFLTAANYKSFVSGNVYQQSTTAWIVQAGLPVTAVPKQD